MIKAATVLLALAGMASAVQAQDASAGRAKAAMCMGCHNIPGYQASFPLVHKVPKIAGQNPDYLVAALTAYRKGERKHPTMRAVAASLNDRDIADLAAFYAGLAPAAAAATAAAAPAAVAPLLERGACSSCHGADFNRPIAPAYPKLAGQHRDYLLAALRAYGTERHPQIGRANPIMSAQVKPFTVAELQTIADYVASLPGDVRTVPESRFR
ncbi:c-type cytochrome [Rubrivivax gelatinosus]|uniref:Class I diheme cytochrome c4 n=1 Tax=Rubrivivax gelatinosus (strain NBRC 100245 / IL144) TaxID=983917 RepID=I0HVJ1_RUBGI|nr:c-type cytochrome [Rubrivivax gelatinosus]BAL97028.1 class I diheme cytochrome c4 [Rubrivivax gelatinosus IL144]